MSVKQSSAEPPGVPARTGPEGEPASRALDLVPLLRANAERTERERRPAPENLAALRKAGLLRLTTPRERGGHEASLRTQVEVGTALGRGCPSTAWVAGIFNGVRPMTLMDMVAAIEDARAALGKSTDLGGTSVFSGSRPLQRYWRDVETGSRLVQFHPFHTREDSGRLPVGVESPVSLLL